MREKRYIQIQETREVGWKEKDKKTTTMEKIKMTESRENICINVIFP